MTFKPGDNVVCIDNSCIEHELGKNKVYTVSGIGLPTYEGDKPYLRLKGRSSHSGWWSNRFRLATEEEIGKANSCSENEIRKVKVDNDGHITFWFFGSKEPWDVTEFETGSETRKYLEEIVDLILSKGQIVQEEIKEVAFKPGDQVMCIDDEGVEHIITKGEIYTVKVCHQDPLHGIYLKGINALQLKSRFVPTKRASQPNLQEVSDKDLDLPDQVTKLKQALANAHENNKKLRRDILGKDRAISRMNNEREINQHIGSSFDSFLKEEGILDETKAQAKEAAEHAPQLHSLIPGCLAPHMSLLPGRINAVVTMALKWQSEKPHVDGCSCPTWSLGNYVDDGKLLLYRNNSYAGHLDSSVAKNILDILSATEEQEKVYCPTCEALAELKKREENE